MTYDRRASWSYTAVVSTEASVLRALSVSLLLAAVTVVGCSKGKSSGDAPGAAANELSLPPPSPPAGPVPIPYPNVNAPAELTPAPAPSPDTVAAPAPKASGHKATGQAAGKRQHAPIQ